MRAREGEKEREREGDKKKKRSRQLGGLGTDYYHVSKYTVSYII